MFASVLVRFSEEPIMVKPRHGFSVETLLGEGRICRRQLDAIRSWNVDDNQPRLSDEQIALFLLSCCGDTELTKHTITSYFKAKTKSPGLFDNWNCDSEEIKLSFKLFYTGVFPVKTEDNVMMVFIKLQDVTVANFSLELACKLMAMTIEGALYDDAPDGVVIFIDLEGVSLMHVTRLRLGTIKSIAFYLQEAMPVKMRALHLMNCVYFIDKIMKFFRPFMKKETLDMMHYHPTDSDMRDFHKNFVPRECLPADYGGTLPTLKQLHETNKRRLGDLNEFFKSEEMQRKLLP